MKKNTARRGISKKVRRLRELVKAEDAYERVRGYSSLSEFLEATRLDHFKAKDDLRMRGRSGYYRHPRRSQGRAPRRRASELYRQEVIMPAGAAYRKMKPARAWTSMMWDDRDYRNLLVEIEESKPHLWPQFLAEYREALGLPPIRMNPTWYMVRLERSRGRKKTYEPLPDEYLADAEFNDLNGAFEAMVEFVTLHLGHLSDARVMPDQTRSKVKAYIDLGRLDGDDLRVVVIPSPHRNPNQRSRTTRRMRARNPLMRPVEGKTAMVVVAESKSRILFILLNATETWDRESDRALLRPYVQPKYEIYGVLEIHREGVYEPAGFGPGTIYSSQATAGYGPLLYDMTAWAVNEIGLSPGLYSDPDSRLEDSDRLWARYLGRASSPYRRPDGWAEPDVWKSPSPQEFKRKYGVSPRSIMDLGHEVMRNAGIRPTKWIDLVVAFEYVDDYHRELSA
jgi:hypothetical protein